MKEDRYEGTLRLSRTGFLQITFKLKFSFGFGYGMTKSISCSDAGKDCEWSATADTEEALLQQVAEHVKADHKEIELTPENVANIKNLIKDV